MSSALLPAREPVWQPKLATPTPERYSSPHSKLARPKLLRSYQTQLQTLPAPTAVQIRECEIKGAALTYSANKRAHRVARSARTSVHGTL